MKSRLNIGGTVAGDKKGGDLSFFKKKARGVASLVESLKRDVDSGTRGRPYADYSVGRTS